MELVTKVFPYIGATCLIFFAIAFIYYAGSTLRKKNETDIRVIWYFFSLTVVITTLIGIWAVETNAISSAGGFEGEHGTFIHAILKSTLDINLSFSIIFSVFAVILLPQILSYFLSGLFGVAAVPGLINESMSFLVWGIAKTFIVVSGVTITVPLFGLVLSWEAFAFSHALSWMLLSVLFCAFSFIVLLFYRECSQVLDDINKYVPSRLLAIAANIHRHCTKYSNQKTNR